MRHILVTGGTGTLGSHVVPQLHDAGCDVRVLSRHNRTAAEGIEYVASDLTTGEGIEPAVEGIEVIVHLAGSQKGDDVKTLNLVRAASKVGAPHLVYISVVGADRIPVVSGIDRAMFGYFASKRAAERVAASSGLPWTILRATQFHELILADGAIYGQTACAASSSQIPLPAGRRRRGGGAARGACPWRARRPRSRHWRAESVRDGRDTARVPASRWQAPSAHSCLDTRQGRPRDPGRS